MTRNAYTPLDVGCPLCRATPGTRCTSIVITSRPTLRRPHAQRVTSARMAEDRRNQPRIPAGTTDAWTCPDCARSYWPPREWEPELWPPVRAAAQQLHATRHHLERTITTGVPDPEPIEDDTPPQARADT